jgi:hypothetical protein
MPMWSLTATRSFRLLQGTSVLLGGLQADVTEEELDLLQFASGKVAQTCACAPQEQGCRAELSRQLFDDLTTHQITFSETPSPQTVLVLLTHRKIRLK